MAGRQTPAAAPSVADQAQELSAAEEALRQAQAKADGPDATAEDAEALSAARAKVEQLVNANATPAVAPAVYAPGEGFGVGERAPANRYGTVDPQGRVTATSKNGATEPKPGQYGAIVVVKGDTVTAEHRRVLGLD